MICAKEEGLYVYASLWLSSGRTTNSLGMHDTVPHMFRRPSV